MRDWSSEGAERFVRGVLPSPVCFFPRVEPVELVKCVNKPSDGLLRGTLFLDGSAFHMDISELARAGWAIARVDRIGRAEILNMSTSCVWRLGRN